MTRKLNISDKCRVLSNAFRQFRGTGGQAINLDLQSELINALRIGLMTEQKKRKEQAQKAQRQEVLDTLSEEEKEAWLKLLMRDRPIDYYGEEEI
jgi:hypothetical protein